MKEGFLEKSVLDVTEHELKQINELSRRELKAEELYVFSVVLCDNEIDRDHEKFTVEALGLLKNMYVGRTGIMDHSMKSSDQTARIFSTSIETDSSRRTADGEVYTALKARAYMPRLKKNEDLITEIDTGIKKEVSVGCSMGSAVCSICGAERKTSPCRHQKGKTYGGKLCFSLLSRPNDAYEWSFVAVPAQKGAGVVKSFKEEEKPMDIMKMLGDGQETLLTADEKAEILKYVGQLSADADAGKSYIEDLRSQAVRLSVLSEFGLPSDTVKSMTDRMNIGELKAFVKAFEKKLDSVLPVSPQLAGKPSGTESSGNSQYKM